MRVFFLRQYSVLQKILEEKEELRLIGLKNRTIYHLRSSQAAKGFSKQEMALGQNLPRVFPVTHNRRVKFNGACRAPFTHTSETFTAGFQADTKVSANVRAAYMQSDIQT